MELRLKHIVFVFIIGSLVAMVGAYLKISSSPAADTILTIGLVTELVGGILLIVKLFTLPDVKKFLNR